jgi:hypothetical protein
MVVIMDLLSYIANAYSSAAPDPTFAFVGGPCCPTLNFVIAFWIGLSRLTEMLNNRGSKVFGSIRIAFSGIRFDSGLNFTH